MIFDKYRGMLEVMTNSKKKVKSIWNRAKGTKDILGDAMLPIRCCNLVKIDPEIHPQVFFRTFHPGFYFWNIFRDISWNSFHDFT